MAVSKHSEASISSWKAA